MILSFRLRAGVNVPLRFKNSPSAVVQFLGSVSYNQMFTYTAKSFYRVFRIIPEDLKNHSQLPEMEYLACFSRNAASCILAFW